MSSTKVAKLNTNGVDIILFEVDIQLSSESLESKEARLELCQGCVQSNGLNGSAVLVWRNLDRTIGSIFAPKEFIMYFRHKTWNDIEALFKTEIQCDY